MTEKMLITGNDAVGWGAVSANCDLFAGYPITPQNEIPAWFARELPKRGGVFVQTQSEIGAINVLFGAATAGARSLTSTASPGWSLMQEGLSHMAYANLPAVVLLVQRGGPGAGSIRHAQMDYLSVTRCGGHGGYKTIVLAPSSVQEVHDFVQTAFYLADKYRNPVVVLTDAVLGQMMELTEIKHYDYDALPDKDWALAGRGKHPGGTFQEVHCSQGIITPWLYLASVEEMHQKYQQITDTEVKCEQYRADDADLLLVAYGYVSRVCREAVDMARDEGLKVGLIRPITLWPFPYEIIKEKAAIGKQLLAVEDSPGQMIDDVKLGAEGKSKVHFLGMFARHIGSDFGLILPDRVLEETKKILKEKR
jgi:2-oxoglutarate/2-oxoacid ferredoxin oxidoreductase subunit alpha